MVHSSTNATNGAKPTKTGHAGRNIGITIVLAIVVAGGLFYYLYLSGGEISLAFAAAQNPASVGQIIFQHINQTKQLGLSYAGMLTANITTPYGGHRISLPFSLKYLKYYNDSKIEFSITNSTLLLGVPNVTIDVLLLNGTSNVVTCYSVGGSAPSCGSINSTLSNLPLLYNLTGTLDIQGLLSQVTNTSIGTPTPSFYGTQPCWAISGSAELNVPGQLVRTLAGSSNVSVSADTCVSPQSYLPLHLGLTLKSGLGSAASLTLDNTGMSLTTNESEVTSLP